MKKIRYSIKRDARRNWVLEPVGACIDFLGTEIAMSGITVRALELMPLIPQLVRVAGIAVVKTEGFDAALPFKKFLNQDIAFDGMSEKLSKNDYSLLNSHTLVSLWSGFETCIEDTVVLTLINDQPAVDVVLKEVRVSGYTGGLFDEKDARRAFRSLERKARQDKGLVESYDWLLGLLDIQRLPCSDLRTSLAEVNALRNAIMHNAGIVNQQTLCAAPSLDLVVGDEILLSRKDINNYFDAISTFVKELLGGVVSSRHIKSSDELNVEGV
tara:strand:- start:1342 stop:2151 length:810 start_codon:yes stop_codon:yes gene_type:complete